MSDQSEAKRHKRGDVREDGMRFWQYQRGKEVWLTPEKFVERKQSAHDSDCRRSQRNPGRTKEYSKKWREANPDRYLEAIKQWRAANEDRVAERQRRWREDNREHVKEYERQRRANDADRRRQTQKEWHAKNREKVKEALLAWKAKNRDYMREKARAYIRRRRALDPLFAASSNLRSRTLAAFRLRGFVKPNGFGKILGCDLATAKAHLESLFQPGMSWENRSEWHIDHIVPLASAKTIEGLVSLCHYTNLQPLWAKDNLRKGAKRPVNLQET